MRRFESLMLPVATALLAFIRATTSSAVVRSLIHLAELRSVCLSSVSAVTFRPGSLGFPTALLSVTPFHSFNMLVVALCTIIF